MEKRIKNISIEEANRILAEYARLNKRPAITAHKDENRNIVGWDFECEPSCDHDILRAPPLLYPWTPHHPSTWPFRYMTTKEPITLNIWNQRRPGEPEYTDKPLPIGTRVKIVMVSRFRDVGITDDLTTEYGYHLRINISELEQKFENFSNEP